MMGLGFQKSPIRTRVAESRGWQDAGHDRRCSATNPDCSCRRTTNHLDIASLLWFQKTLRDQGRLFDFTGPQFHQRPSETAWRREQGEAHDLNTGTFGRLSQQKKMKKSADPGLTSRQRKRNRRSRKFHQPFPRQASRRNGRCRAN